MAYVSKEKKAKIAEELKKVVPADWKYSLAVRNRSSIVMTIRSAPKDLPLIAGESNRGFIDINHHLIDRYFEADLLEVFKKIVKALNTDNYDYSDAMTDYFNVGHYVTLQIGKWDKPFIFTGKE